MNEPQSVESIDRGPVPARGAVPRPRAIGSPLPTGGASRPAFTNAQSYVRPIAPAAADRSLPGAAPSEEFSGVQRAVSAVRAILPLAQRLLPLLDGNIATTIASLFAPRPHPAAPAPAPKIDLAPLEASLGALQTQHRSLRDQVAEQNTALRRVEDRLDMVREATDRNTLEQQELLEDLKSFSNKVKVVGLIGLGLVGVAFLLNLILFLHIQRVLP